MEEFAGSDSTEGTPSEPLEEPAGSDSPDVTQGEPLEEPAMTEPSDVSVDDETDAPGSQMALEPDEVLPEPDTDVVPEESPELDAIMAELGGQELSETPSSDEPPEAQEEPMSEVAQAAAALDPSATSVLEQVGEAEAEAQADAAALDSEVPSGEDAEAVEAWLEAEEEEQPEAVKRDRTMSLPFFIYVGVWFVFGIAEVLTLKDVALSGTPVYSETYGLFLYGAIALSVIGPLLALTLWLIVRRRTERERRRGLFAIAALRGAMATFAGVALFIVALYVLDLVKTGVLRW